MSDQFTQTGVNQRGSAPVRDLGVDCEERWPVWGELGGAIGKGVSVWRAYSRLWRGTCRGFGAMERDLKGGLRAEYRLGGE